MQRCWQQQRLSLSTRLRLYQTCVLQILLHGADTWTLLADYIRRLQSFHMGCQRQLLGVKWRTWIQQFGEGTPASWRQMWQSAEERGHRGESSQRTTAVYTLHDDDDDE